MIMFQALSLDRLSRVADSSPLTAEVQTWNLRALFAAAGNRTHC